MTPSADVETVERTIPALPEVIFALLADPSRHHDFDGSGMVKEAKNGPERVKLGDKFGMAMKYGVPYSTHNIVIEFEDNRRIAWQHSGRGPRGAVVRRGAIWRYELEPVDGGTKVHETLDFSAVRGIKPLVRLDRWRNTTRAGMEKTLENVEKVLAST